MIRRLGPADAGLLAELFCEFNAEFDLHEPDAALVQRLAAPQLESGEIAAWVWGDPPVGFAQMRLRSTLYDEGRAACLEELWVRPAARRRGVGQQLLEVVLAEARAAGATYADLSTSTDDAAARRLYERNGFTNLENGVPTASMLYYERPL